MKNKLLKIDRILAIFGIIASSILIYMGKWGQISEIGVIVLLACLIYLILGNRLLHVDRFSLKEGLSKRFFLIFSILFFVLFTFSLIAIITRPELYKRPYIYFVFTSISSAFLAVEIAYSPRERICQTFILFQIILLALSFRWILQLLYPGLVYFDTWYHQYFTTASFEMGRILDGMIYSDFPAFHLLIGSGMETLGVGFKSATMVCMSTAQTVILTFFIFLLGKKVFNSVKIGLLGALLLVISQESIKFSFMSSSTTLAALFLLVGSYIILRHAKTYKVSPSSIALSIIFMLALIITHPPTSVAMVILLLCLWVISKFYQVVPFMKEKTLTIITIAPLLIFVISMLSWWMYVSEFVPYEMVRLVSQFFSINTLGRWPSSEVITYLSTIPIQEYWISPLGLMFFFFFSILGSVFILKKFNNNRSFGMVVSGWMMVGVSFAGLLFGLAVWTPRWYHLSQLFLAIPAAIGLFIISFSFKRKPMKVVALTALVFIMSFFMITGGTTNYDNPLYSKDLTLRMVFTQSELAGMKTTATITKENISIDSHASVFLKYYYCPNHGNNSNPLNICDITRALLYKNFTDLDNKLIVIRSYIVDNPFYALGPVRLSYNPKVVLENNRFDQVYDSESIYAFFNSYS